MSSASTFASQQPRHAPLHNVSELGQLIGQFQQNYPAQLYKKQSPAILLSTYTEKKGVDSKTQLTGKVSDAAAWSELQAFMWSDANPPVKRRTVDMYVPTDAAEDEKLVRAANERKLRRAAAAKAAMLKKTTMKAPNMKRPSKRRTAAPKKRATTKKPSQIKYPGGCVTHSGSVIVIKKRALPVEVQESLATRFELAPGQIPERMDAEELSKFPQDLFDGADEDDSFLSLLLGVLPEV